MYGQQPGYGYGPPPSMQRMEQMILQEPGVQVTTARFVVGSATYPLGGITSVQSFAEAPKRRGAIWSIIIGVLFVVVGVAVVPLLLLGLLMVGIGGYLAATAKGTYGVVIMTAGVQTRAVVSTDLTYVQRISAALNNALAMR